MNSNEIISLINQLGEKLSAPAQEVWGIYLKQTIVFGYIDLICGLVMFGFMVWAVRLLLMKDKDGNKKYLCSKNYNDDLDMARGVCWASEVILLVWSLLLVIYGIMYLTNPVYWVLDNFANIILK